MSTGIALSEYRARRKKLLQQMAPNTAAVLFAAPPAYRSGHSEYAYRQDNDFYYLSGFNESHAVLVLLPGAATPVVLFNQTSDPEAERWSGPRVGLAAAVSDYGMDAAFPIDEINTRLPALLADKKIIYYPMGKEACDKQLLQAIKQAQKARASLPDLKSVQQLIAVMRCVKSPAEIKLMRRAAEISAQAHIIAMKKIRADLFEYQLAAEYIYAFTVKGARDVAYLPIVGGGENACILHYTANTAALRAGELVLVDAGCEYQNYCADVSRTFPVNGKFTPAQRAIYTLVLAAYQAGLKKIYPGSDWPSVEQAVVTVLTRGLVALKLLRGTVPKLIAQKAYRQFFMHGVGHWLGLDVHDTGPYKNDDKPVAFMPGMVLTLEPGIYITPDKQIDKQYWHIGVRIEDDILVTEQGHEVLSSAAPITPDDIEQLMR